MANCMRTVVIAALMCAPVSGSFAQIAPVPPPPAATVLIFDGSGSMWGKLDGERLTKLVQVREAVGQALSKFNPQTSALGLVSFGHRRQSDCSDVQIIAAPEPAPAAAFTNRIAGPLDKLNPKGKGPLTAALREAAKALGKAVGPRSIVMIHDDPDNCQQDPCAALGELQQSAPGVIVHIVGLGLKPDDAARYQCLTRPTGGRLINAQNGAQIQAGIGDVLQLAALGMRATDAAPAQAAAQRPAARPTVAVPPPAAIDLARDGPPALRLRALFANRQPASGHPIRWTVTPEAQSSGARSMTYARGADAAVALPPATYKIHVSSGLVSADITATAGLKGETLAEAVLNAGAIVLKAPLAADATVTIYEKVGGAAADNPSGTARAIGIWPHGETSVLMPSGPLLLRLEQGELRSERSLTLAAGQTVEVDLVQAGGRVILDLAALAGPALEASNPQMRQPVVFSIAEDDPDAASGRREVARSAAAVAEFVVAPGTYLIMATRGTIEARDRITVSAGEVVRRSLPLASARLMVSARLGKMTESPADAGAPETFRIARLDSTGETVAMLAGPAAVIDLPPGRYRVEARRNNAAIRSDQEIELRQGEFRVLSIEHQVGQVHMSSRGTIEALGEAIAWHILDSGGRAVWSAYQPRPTALLGAGRYRVGVEIHGRRREQTIDVRAGEVSTVTLDNP